MSIATECMVVSLSISRWYGFARDAQLGRDVATSHNADNDTTNVSKRLMPATALKDVNSSLTAIRSHFYESTLPWRDKGDRLLTRKMYMDFVEKHEDLKRKAVVAIEKFITEVYPRELDRAEFRMGDMFNPGDYPSQAELWDMYKVRLDFEPVGDASDFRVDMDQRHVDSIRESIERGVNERIASAMREVWGRLAKTLKHFHDRMADTDATFKKATVDNLREIAEILPKLNVLDDPDLEAIRQDIEQHLVDHDAADLRKDSVKRQEVTTEAKRIMDTMDGFMSAFGGTNQ